MPQPATPASSYDCKFDAWDRLVEVKVTGGAVVSTLRYDGLKRRLTKVAGGNTRHYYYSSRWQVLEERLNALTTADRQFVWGIRHVDDLVERDRSSERFYVLHDHLSVTAIINTTGAVQERYGYDGFGPQRVMDASFGARASSLYDWETGFAAYRLDTESGLYQVRHRCYHPKLGRWTSRDPLEYNDSANLYTYALNRSIAQPDPSGSGIVYDPSCTPQNQKDLDDGLKKACQNAISSGCLSCLSAKGRKKMEDLCTGKYQKNVRVKCKRCSSCGSSCFGRITICVNNLTQCGAGCTLLHELAHSIGGVGADWPTCCPLADKRAYNIETCIGCNGPGGPY
ncbi:MAG: RHS repeat-associated core domain-containing protein [Verrucomicrobia bacterium]|nr:RHS repeat-associated core domain-containing protein [Verrucomicrobiota bacterium]